MVNRRVAVCGLLACCVALTAGLVSADAGEALEVSTAEAAPPVEVAASIRAVLPNQVVRLSGANGPAIELWFRDVVPLDQAPGGEFPLKSAKAATVLGVVKIYEARRDFRDDGIEPGVYTMRLGMLPQDGAHMGTSPSPYFALLVPAHLDTGLDAIADQDSLNASSAQETATGHPTVLNIQPIEAGSGTFPRTDAPNEETKRVCVSLSAEAGGNKTPVAFGLVYEGHGEI